MRIVSTTAHHIAFATELGITKVAPLRLGTAARTHQLSSSASMPITVLEHRPALTRATRSFSLRMDRS